MIYTESLARLKEKVSKASAIGDLDALVVYVPAKRLLPVELHILEKSRAALSMDTVNGIEYWCLRAGPELGGSSLDLIRAARVEARANPHKRILIERHAKKADWKYADCLS